METPPDIVGAILAVKRTRAQWERDGSIQNFAAMLAATANWHKLRLERYRRDTDGTPGGS